MIALAAARRAHSLYSDLVPAAYAAGNHDLGPNGDTEARGSLFADYASFADYRRRPGFGGVYDREPDRTENSYLYTFLLRQAVLQWTGAREDEARATLVNRGYVAVSLLVYTGFHLL